MRIKRLNLIQFRNYRRLQVDFGKSLNIFIGENAAGKTNILEAIEVLALTKSHRTNDMHLFMHGKNVAKIKGSVQVSKITRKLEVELNENCKKLKINDTPITKMSDYIAALNVIVFSPDDIEIIKGSPSIRRNLLNMELSQISKLYLATYNQFNKLLKTRNEYLKILYTNHLADLNYFQIITDKLVDSAVLIYQMRKEYIDKINQNIGKIYHDIHSSFSLQIHYEPSISFSSYESEKMKEEMKKIYKKTYQKELNYGMTLSGPHRDDFALYLDEKDLKVYGSQGQQKAAVLAYKLACIPIFEERTDTKPVLLLDDVFSELDGKKQNKLLQYIGEDIQSIITTTDIKNIRKSLLKNATIFKVVSGTVERKM